MQNNMARPVWPESKRVMGGFPIVDTETSLSVWRLLTLIIAPFIIFNLTAIPTLFWSDKVLAPYGTVMLLLQTFLPLILDVVLIRYVGRVKFGRLYRRITWRAIGFGLLMLVIGTIFSLVMATVFSKFLVSDLATSSSPALSGAAQLRVMIFNEFLNLFNLMNEELLAIIPFLGAMALAKHYFGWSRTASMILGLIASVFFFGLAHYQAYNWHLFQMFFVIGASRIFDTTIYIRTKNVWISYIVHYVYDTVTLFL